MSCAFSAAHYRELLEAAKAGGYRFVGFENAPEAGDLLLRHDVDLSLPAAVGMAEIEAELGVRSTWFLMTRSVFYNLRSKEGADAVERLRACGGWIAHHAVWPDVDLDEPVGFERVVAWHNPEPEYVNEPIDGAVNVMTAPWFDPGHYRSDSNQHWRNGCPDEQLAAGGFEWLQLLIHPEIWMYDGKTMGETMRSFLDGDRDARLEHLRHDRIDLD
jgi:hypothetical protein